MHGKLKMSANLLMDILGDKSALSPKEEDDEDLVSFLSQLVGQIFSSLILIHIFFFFSSRKLVTKEKLVKNSALQQKN
jgi:hypothetical protein